MYLSRLEHVEMDTEMGFIFCKYGYIGPFLRMNLQVKP